MGSKKHVMVLICAPPSCSVSVRQPRAATARMRTARLARRQAAGNRFSAGQAPVAAAIVRAPMGATTAVAPRSVHLYLWALYTDIRRMNETVQPCRPRPNA